MVATDTRTLVTGGRPDAAFPVPDESYFEDRAFIEDNRLTDVGNALLAKKFRSLDGEVTVSFLWKGKGGQSGGRMTAGKCVKNSGLALHYSQGTDYTIWIAADYARVWAFNNWQLEALVFHELCHIQLVEPDENHDEPQKKTVGHDAEVFYAELEQYGLWMQDLERLGEVVQPSLPFEGMADRPQVSREILNIAANAAKNMLGGKDSGIESITFSAGSRDKPIGEPVTISRADLPAIEQTIKDTR